jgi:hypothetical protein
MKKVGLLILLAFTLFRCENDSSKDCSTPATIRDLTGLDGCGWVFELQDGARLEPIWAEAFCGFGQYKEENSLHDFEFVDGKPVLINYEIIENGVSICMVGPVVKITCISEAVASIAEN